MNLRLCLVEYGIGELMAQREYQIWSSIFEIWIYSGQDLTMLKAFCSLIKVALLKIALLKNHFPLSMNPPLAKLLSPKMIAQPIFLSFTERSMWKVQRWSLSLYFWLLQKDLCKGTRDTAWYWQFPRSRYMYAILGMFLIKSLKINFRRTRWLNS